MDAARSKERASDSSSKGIATLFQDLNPFTLWPRKRWARLMRVTAVTNCGTTEVAITTATPNSYT